MPKCESTLYTAFLFVGISDPNVLHCTHKYFGKGVDKRRCQAIFNAINFYFNEDRTMPQVEFTRRRFFGPKGDTPVLIPRTFDNFPWLFFPELKRDLDAFGKDDHVFRPHVTTKLKRVARPINRYALIDGDEIVKTWWSAKENNRP